MTTRGDEDPKSELVERVRRFIAEEVAPRAAGIDRENALPATSAHHGVGDGQVAPPTWR